jgi:hypothetical protein
LSTTHTQLGRFLREQGKNRAALPCPVSVFQIGIYGADAQFKIGPCRSSRIVGRGLAPAAENGTFSVFLKENMNLSPAAIPFCDAK